MSKTTINISKDASGVELKGTLITCFDESDAKATVLVCPAMGITSRYYEHMATFFSENNYNVCILDYRGTGLSAPRQLRGLKVTLFDWASDIAAAIQFLNHKYPTQPLIFVGHSMGSQLLGFVHNNQLIDKVVFVASSTGYWKDIKEQFKNLFLLSIVLPFSNIVWGYTNAKLFGQGENYPKCVSLQWKKWCFSPKYLGVELEQSTKAPFYPVVQTITSIWFTDDVVANKVTVPKLLAFHTGKYNKSVAINPLELGLSKIGHAGFLSRKMKDSVWPMILKELKENTEKVG